MDTGPKHGMTFQKGCILQQQPRALAWQRLIRVRNVEGKADIPGPVYRGEKRKVLVQQVLQQRPAGQQTSVKLALVKKKEAKPTAKKTERCFKPECQKLNCAADHELSVSTTWIYRASGLLSTKNLKSLTGNCGLWRWVNVTRQGDEVIIKKTL